MEFQSGTQFSSVAQLCSTLCNPMKCSTPGFPVHHQLQELTQTHIHWIGDMIRPFYPLSSPSPPTSIFSSIWVFSSEPVLRIRWPNYWSFNFSISPSNEHSGLICLGWTGWISLQSKGLSRVFNTTVQKHQKYLRHSAFFIVQLSHPYVTTGKTIALTKRTFVGKVMSLLFNILCRLVITFLSWS